jgi:4-oxalocrotonate tautomerase
MPLVRNRAYWWQIGAIPELGDIVYKALIDAINIPEDDKFQVIAEHAPEELNVAASYLGNRYSSDVIFIQITLSAGRSVEIKKAFYRRVVDDLHDQLNMRREDVVINLVEVARGKLVVRRDRAVCHVRGVAWVEFCSLDGAAGAGRRPDPVGPSGLHFWI